MTEQTDIAARLAAAGLPVKPLEWKHVDESTIEAVADKRLYVVFSMCGGDLHRAVYDRILELGTRARSRNRERTDRTHMGYQDTAGSWCDSRDGAGRNGTDRRPMDDRAADCAWVVLVATL